MNNVCQRKGISFAMAFMYSHLHEIGTCVANHVVILPARFSCYTVVQFRRVRAFILGFSLAKGIKWEYSSFPVVCFICCCSSASSASCCV